MSLLFFVHFKAMQCHFNSKPHNSFNQKNTHREQMKNSFIFVNVSNKIWLLKCKSLATVNEYFKDVRRLKSINTLSHWKRSAAKKKYDWLCDLEKCFVNECVFGDTKSGIGFEKIKMENTESMRR